MVLLGAVPVSASPILVLAPDQGPSPSTVAVTGEGFSPMVEIAFTVGGVASGSATSDAAGSVKMTLTITGPPGQSVEVRACQADATGGPCGVWAAAPFRIIGPATTTSTTTTSTTTTTTSTTTTTTTRPPTTTTRPPTTTTQTTLPATTIAPGPMVTSPAVTVTTTTVPALVAPGPGDGGSGDGGDSDESGLFWFLLIAGAGVVGWLIGFLVRRGKGDRPRRGQQARDHVVVGSKVKEVVREASLPDDVPERLELGGTGYDGEDGVFVEPPPPRPDGEVIPKVDVHPVDDEGPVFPKLEVGPEATETKGKGMVEATWKVEEGEKAGPMFPKLDSPAGEAEGKVFPKLEIDPGPGPEPAKGGNPETTWKVEEGEKAGKVFPKVELDAGPDAEGKVFPKVEIHGTAAEGGEVIPKLEIDTGSLGDEGAGEVTFGDGRHGSRPGSDPPPDGDILDHLDDED